MIYNGYLLNQKYYSKLNYRVFMIQNNKKMDSIRRALHYREQHFIKSLKFHSFIEFNRYSVKF